MSFAQLVGSIVLFALWAGSLSAHAQANLRLEAEFLTHPTLEEIHSGPLPDVEVTDSVTIRIGEPVSVRVRLANTGDEPTEPFVPMRLRSNPPLAKITGPDAQSVTIRLGERGPPRCGRAPAGSLGAAQGTAFQTYLFERRRESPDGVPFDVYLFERPDEYEIEFEFLVRSEWGAAERQTVRSDPLAVIVLNESVEDWEALKAQALVRKIGGGWPRLGDAPELIELIECGNLTWLQDWARRWASRESPPASDADSGSPTDPVPEPDADRWRPKSSAPITDRRPDPHGTGDPPSPTLDP